MQTMDEVQEQVQEVAKYLEHELLELPEEIKAGERQHGRDLFVQLRRTGFLLVN